MTTSGRGTDENPNYLVGETATQTLTNKTFGDSITVEGGEIKFWGQKKLMLCHLQGVIFGRYRRQVLVTTPTPHRKILI